ncbi:MAG: DUF4212 domain-containing protein [Phycisphaerales bacterium]|nr:DUF4212 domain-containing protein [Phycisphaerales bacterium]
MSPKEYWSFNVKFVSILLSIWAFVSFGCGMVFAPWLDQFKLIGTEYPLGFWFAQQGSIYVFVLLIITYVIVMNRVDKKFKDGHQ